MLLVEIEKPENVTLAAWFSELRGWLDDNRCEPTIFAQANRLDRLIYRVSFDTAEQAQQFASRFSHYAGTVRSPTAGGDAPAEAETTSRAKAIA